jgi:SAM-dependent methyltransferase
MSRPGNLRVVVASLIVGPGEPLTGRYTADAVEVFDPDERIRFLDSAGAARDQRQLAWELLYRIEPELYARLVEGEGLHDGVLAWLPARCERVLEIGSGAGRLTLELARRSTRVTAVEPAAPLRRLLMDRLRGAGVDNVDVVRGFFDDLPAPAHSCDLVVSCSAFCLSELEDPDHCLEVMEGCVTSGGMVAIIWPGDVPWLLRHGFSHTAFAGPMLVEYASLDEALEMARIFYPDAVAAVARRGSRFVDPATLGLTAPRDVCWKRCP